MLSGLSGSGKDTWLHHQQLPSPVISLDNLRTRLGVNPAENQRQVVAATREHARDYLRQEQGFIWNATNVTRSLRGPLIRFFADYKARTKVIYLEIPWPELLQRNKERTQSVPESVLDNLVAKLDVLDETEAQRVVWVIGK